MVCLFRLDEETQYKGLDPLVLVESGRRLERARWHPTNDNIFATVAASDRSVYLYDAQYTQAGIYLMFLPLACHMVVLHRSHTTQVFVSLLTCLIRWTIIWRADYVTYSDCTWVVLLYRATLAICCRAVCLQRMKLAPFLEYAVDAILDLCESQQRIAKQ
jgi:hypothetical protein